MVLEMIVERYYNVKITFIGQYFVNKDGKLSHTSAVYSKRKFEEFVNQ